MNIDTVYSLKIKLGEATTTTAPSVVCSYSIAREKTELGAVSGVESPQVATATTDGATEVTILSRTSISALDNRYRIDSLYVCNRDTVAHTVYLFYETAGGTESYITSGVSIAAGATLQVASDGTISRVPESGGIVAVTEGGTGTGTAPTLAQILIAQSTSAYAPKTASGDWTIDANGVATLASASSSFAFTGDISPTALSADQNDWSPTGLSTASVIRASASSAGRNITGLAGGADGRIIVLYNTGSLFLTLKNESASSSAANRFSFGGLGTVTNPDISLWTGDSVVLMYDSTASRWRCIAQRINTPTFEATRTTNQTVNTGSGFNKIQYATETFDTHGWYDNATNYRFQPLLPGKYRFSWGVLIDAIGDTRYIVASLFKNGSEFKRGCYSWSPVAASSQESVGTALVDANGSSDYFEVHVIQSDTSNRDILGSSAFNYFAGEYVP